MARTPPPTINHPLLTAKNISRIPTYLYNAWSDGKTTYRAEPMNGLAFKAMQSAANGSLTA